MRKRLGIREPIIALKNKDKIIQEEIKKNPPHLTEYENRFKSKLKNILKKEQQKPHIKDNQSLKK
ncbi:hypothetical protein [Klebsiella pneumoniae]|nr:hypothetical protein [Klebsiella pneumoniae]